MRNPFDPFGVFGEWKGQEPEDNEELGYIDEIANEVYEAHGDNLYNIMVDSVSAGVLAERSRVLHILRTELKSLEDLGHVIKLIESKE